MKTASSRMTLKEQNEITASGFTLRKEIQQCPCVEREPSSDSYCNWNCAECFGDGGVGQAGGAVTNPQTSQATEHVGRLCATLCMSFSSYRETA